MKSIRIFLSENFHFLVVKFSVYLNILQTGMSVKKKNKKNGMANSVDPDEMARHEPSHLELHCLHRHPFWSTELKELKST